MRNRLTIAVFALAILFSQGIQAQVFSYGAKLGLGFPGLINDTIASQRITLAAGLTGGLRINEMFQIMTEVGYQRKGNKYSAVYNPVGPVVKDSTFVKTNLDYIQVPLYVKVNIGRSSKFYLQAGGYYGFLVHANYTGARGDTYLTKEPVREYLHSGDYGLIGGGGIETPIRPGLGVVLDVKYQWGLKDIAKDQAVLQNPKPLLNKGLVMSMGVYVDIE